MKNVLRAAGIAAVALSIASVSLAQPPRRGVPPPPPDARLADAPRPGSDGPGGPGLRGGPGGQITQLTTLTGRVGDFVANDRYEYDAFSLQTGGSTVTVRFPASMGEQLMKSASKGSEVSLTGVMDQTPEGTQEFHLYSVTAGGKTWTDTPPAVPQTPPVEEIRDFSGTVSEFSHDRRGTINGVVLDSRLLVELPPPAVEQLLSLIKTGTRISGSGVLRVLPTGVVSTRNMQVTGARTISINGQTYLIR